MSRRSLWLLLVPLLLLPLIAGIIVAAVLLSRSLSAPPAFTTLARYMPSDTAAFLSLDLRAIESGGESWEIVRRAFLDLVNAPTSLGHELLKGSPFDWEDDVKPWLGDHLAVGFLDLSFLQGGLLPTSYDYFEEEPPPRQTPALLLAVEVKDTRAWEDFLDRLREERERSGHPLEESRHGQTTVYTLPDTPISLALRERVLLASLNRDTIEDALDRAEKDSLVAAPDYRAAVSRLPAGGLVLGYMNTESLGQFAGAPSSSLLGLVAFGANQSYWERAMAFTVVAEPQGLRMIAATVLDREAIERAGLGETFWPSPLAGRALRFVPEDVTLAFTGQDLRGAWEMQLRQLKEASPETYRSLRNSLDFLAQQEGLDLEEEVLSWMTGEYALWVTLGAEGVRVSPLPGEIGFVIQVSDKSAARRAMDRIEGLLEESSRQRFEDRTIEGVQVRAISDPSSGTLVGYAFVDDFFVFALGRNAFRDTFRAGQDAGDRLESSAEFRAVTAALPGQRSALAFVNLASLVDFIEDSMGSSARRDFARARRALDHFPGLGMAAAAARAGEEVLLTTVFIHVVP